MVLTGSPGAYTPDPRLELVRATLATGSDDLSTMTFRLRYGSVKWPHASGFLTETARDLIGQWAALTAGPGGPYQFTGKIVHSSLEAYGVGSVGSTGRMQFTAVGPLHVLMQSTVAQSYWSDGEASTSTRTPSFNARDRMGRLVGNRSSAKSGSSYVFGGTELWSRYDVLEYVLGRFGGGYQWTIGGQTTFLRSAFDTIELSGQQSAASIVRRLVNPAVGLDFAVEASGTRLRLSVFSIAPLGTSFLGARVPKAGRSFRVQVGQRPEIPSAELTTSIDQQYGKLRVIGARVVSCFTLRADTGDLEGRWSSDLEDAYKAGTGTSSDEPEDHDRARADPQFSAVYQRFGAPDDWRPARVAASPEVSQTGTVGATNAAHQNTERSTLGWLPIREGFPDAEAGEFQAPMVWLYDETLARYVSAESVGVGVSVPRDDWGVVLNASPNHLLAADTWTGAEATETAPRYSAGKVVATIAVELEQRLAVEVTVGTGDRVLEIEAPGCELWFVASGTVYGCNPSTGELLKTSEAQVLRNDNSRLGPAMAGALARYGASRARGEVNYKGTVALGGLLGAIFGGFTQGGNQANVGAPVTSITWTGGKAPMCSFRAGYKR